MHESFVRLSSVHLQLVVVPGSSSHSKAYTEKDNSSSHSFGASPCATAKSSTLDQAAVLGYALICTTKC